ENDLPGRDVARQAALIPAKGPVRRRAVNLCLCAPAHAAASMARVGRRSLFRASQRSWVRGRGLGPLGGPGAVRRTSVLQHLEISRSRSHMAWGSGAIELPTTWLLVPRGELVLVFQPRARLTLEPIPVGGPKPGKIGTSVPYWDRLLVRCR